METWTICLSVLPQNVQIGDILCKSRSEELQQEGLSMLQVLATKFEREGKDRAPNQESSVIQTARALARVASWNRGHDPKFSSAGTERDSIHHCEEHWLPSATQKIYKEDWLQTRNIPDVLQQGIWLKIVFCLPPEIRKSLMDVQPAVHKDPAWLLFFSCSVMSEFPWPYELQHARRPCPSPSPEACSNSLHWVAEAIQPACCVPSLLLLPSIFPRIRFCFVLFCFQMSWLFPSGGQSIGA